MAPILQTLSGIKDVILLQWAKKVDIDWRSQHPCTRGTALNLGLSFGGWAFLPEIMSHIFILQPQQPLVMALTALVWHLHITSLLPVPLSKKWTTDGDNEQEICAWVPSPDTKCMFLIACLLTVFVPFAKVMSTKHGEEDKKTRSTRTHFWFSFLRFSHIWIL